MLVDLLTRFESCDYPVLSLYVTQDALRTSVRTRIVDLLKPFRERPELDHDAQMSLRADFDAAADLADQIEVDRPPTAAIFACNGGGLFEYVRLPKPVWDVAVVADRPYLRPLRTIREPKAVAIAVADRHHAWLYSMNGGEVRLLETIEESEEHKGNFGGFSGYEERTNRNHAEVLEQRHFRLVADRLFEHHRRLDFGAIVFGGHDEIFSKFQASLHPYLTERFVGAFVIDPRTMTDSDLMKRADELVGEAVRKADEQLGTNVFVTAREGGKAVLGLPAVLQAVNADAIDHLVVAGRFTRDGTVCSTCGRLGRNSSACEACGSETRHTVDVVDATIERVLRTGGSADQIFTASLLDGDGIGAMLRFPIPT